MDAPDLEGWAVPDLSGWDEVLPVFDAPDPEDWAVPDLEGWAVLDLGGWDVPAWDVSANMPSRTQLDGGSGDGSTGPDPDAVTP